MNASGHKEAYSCVNPGAIKMKRLHVNLRDKVEIVLYRMVGPEKKTRTLKVRIPWEVRESLREQLDLLGINRANLFPDLGSAASYLTWAVHQRKSPYSR